jgi:hypothetical protein
MKKLSFLAGKWAGEAVIIGPSGAVKVKQTEDVQMKLGGILLVVEGTGRGRIPETEPERVVFNAFAAIHYDPADKKYKMRAYNQEGHTVDPELTITENGFVWEFTPPKTKVRVRYTAKITGDKWIETGEVSGDDVTWKKFLDMDLKRVKE